MSTLSTLLMGYYTLLVFAMNMYIRDEGMRVIDYVITYWLS